MQYNLERTNTFLLKNASNRSLKRPESNYTLRINKNRNFLRPQKSKK